MNQNADQTGLDHGEGPVFQVADKGGNGWPVYYDPAGAPDS